MIDREKGAEPEQSGTPNQQKTDGLLVSIQRAVRSLFGKKSVALPPAVYLPETVTYAARYRDAQFGKNEVESMLQPQYQGTGLYLAMKFLDHFPDEQRKILEMVLQNTAQGGDYPQLYSRVLEQFLELREPAFREHSMDGKKVAQIYRQGFQLFEDRFRDLAAELYEGEHIPTLLCYAGVLGLKPFLEQLPVGKKLFLLNPKAVSTPSVPGTRFGYVIERTDKDFLLNEFHSDEDFEAAAAGQKIVLIDDTKNTGATLEKVRQLFAGHPKWPPVAAERFLASPGAK